MNVGVDTDQGDVLDAMWGAFYAASREVEADPLSVMRHAYLDGKSKAARDEKFLAGVGQHIYIGQYADDATSLSYLNARYYDGARGQFISEDPAFLSIGSSQEINKVLTDPQILNAYTYSRDNPIIRSDPSGLFNITTGQIQKGDTLNAIPALIDKTYNVNYNANDLARANDIKNPNVIYAGRYLTYPLPSRSSGSARVPSLTISGLGSIISGSNGGSTDFNSLPISKRPACHAWQVSPSREIVRPSTDELRSADDDGCGDCRLRTASMDNGAEAQDC